MLKCLTILYFFLLMVAKPLLAQQNLRGTNPDSLAPVNVKDVHLRPANPVIKQAIVTKGAQVFRVEHDKPAPEKRVMTGDNIQAPISTKEQEIKQRMAEMKRKQQNKEEIKP